MAVTKRKEDTGPGTRLAAFIEKYQPLFVLTGAGCSTASGIPDYRNERGEWKHRKPVDIQDFRAHELTRKHYWARSMLGWPIISAARPADAHIALQGLEQAGLVEHLVTQNVDSLHQKAGSTRVLDLHGNLQTVSCTDCGHRLPRQTVQQQLEEANPLFNERYKSMAPDGDAELETRDFSAFELVCCPQCAGMLKPEVVFFGESVPRETVARAMEHLQAARAVLVVGSSLMVYSAYRFCRAALANDKAMCAVNRGQTRADAELTIKIEEDCGTALGAALTQLGL